MRGGDGCDYKGGGLNIENLICIQSDNGAVIVSLQN